MSTVRRSGQIDFDLALPDPSAVFAAPEEILTCDSLSQQQKKSHSFSNGSMTQARSRSQKRKE